MMLTGSAIIVFILPDKQNNNMSVLDLHSLECQISCPTKQRSCSLVVVLALQKSLAARIIINDDSAVCLLKMTGRDKISTNYYNIPLEQ